MAFIPWKDRIKQYTHRYTLTNVSGSTYDFAEVTGEVIESGTPVNAENLNKLIQRDGDDIKDTVTTFTEASTRANIATGEKTSTIFGKIKKWFTDLKEHAFNDLATVQGAETDKAPTNKLLQESSYARVYKTIPELELSGGVTTVQVLNAMIDNSLTTLGLNSLTIAAGNLHTITDLPAAFGDFIAYKTLNTNATGHRFLVLLSTSIAGGGALYRAVPVNSGMTVTSVAWEQVLSDKNISTVMPLSSGAASNDKVLSEKVVYDEFALKAPKANPTFTGTVTVPAPTNPTDAVRLQDVMELSAVYDKVIRTQAEFEALIASPTWLDVVSVAFVGQFTLSTPGNSGVQIPATVKQIHGFNGAKITVTNFLFNPSTSNGGLWYDTLPTTLDYSIRDLEVDCTGGGAMELGFGFMRCSNLTNCTGTGRGAGAPGYGFYNCMNLTNCTGTGTGTGTGGYGFMRCSNLTNCTGTGTGGSDGYGFRNCTNLTNCTGGGTGTYGIGFDVCTNLTNCTGTGTGTGTGGFGFYSITNASNCRDGGSTTNMWGGTNTNIDIDTCRMTPVAADNTTLNNE